jgi:hypothetical protein
MGIPARELNGYAIASDTGANTPLSLNVQGGDLLHAWVEFYDPEYGWIAIDPTWGSTSKIDYFTKLDTNHLVFAIKGTDPYLPLPAGTYKTDGEKKQVNVDFATSENQTDFEPEITLFKTTDFNIFNKLNEKEKYLLQNDGKIAIFYNGKSLLPTQTTDFIVNTNEEIIVSVKDTLGKGYNLKPEISNEKLKPSALTFITAFFSILLLCTVLYIALKKLAIISKILRNLNERLRKR